MLVRALVVVASVATACGGSSSTGDSAGDSTTTSSSTTVPLEVTTDTCTAYLEFLRAQDGVELNSALADLFRTVEYAELTAAILTLRDGTGPLAEVRSASDFLRGKLVPACEATFSAEVSAVGSNDEAAQLLVDAMGTGDRDMASAVAWANVVAQLEPWEPLTAGSPDFQVEADELTIEMEQGVVVFCVLGQGQIILCEIE